MDFGRMEWLRDDFGFEVPIRLRLQGVLTPIRILVVTLTPLRTLFVNTVDYWHFLKALRQYLPLPNY